MADSKITALASISTSTDPAVDPLVIVDVSDTSMAATGTTKKVTLNNLLSSSPTATGALTVTGLVTAGSATITGAATVGTTFAVGTVTPDIFGRFYTRSIGFDSSGSTVLQIDGTSYGGIDLGAAGVRTFSLTSSATDANISTVTNIPMNFNINGATKMTLNTAGNLAFPSGKGIDFSATASGSGTMTSELLNDYEEGTFTPTVGGSTVAGTGTYSVQTGFYTKVGNLVTVEVFLTWTNIVGATGIMILAGLPFQSTSSTNAYSAASIAYVNNISLTASNVLTGMINPGSSFVELQQYPVGGGASTTVTIDTAGSIIYTATYRV